MDRLLETLDWALVQSFLAVAEGGSLSAAARDLGASQPTLGRQIKAMEQALGVTLFTRLPRGLAVTDTGQEILPAARAMREAMNAIRLATASRETQEKGTVRITASANVAFGILPPVIARIRRDLPDIAIELVSSDDTENLLYGEADIAVRMYRPTQLDVVTQFVGKIELGLYAAPEYIKHKGNLTTMRDMWKHDVVGFDKDQRIIRGFQAYGETVKREFFPVRCDDPLVQWELVAAGCGIGFNQRHSGDIDPRVERILPDLPLPELDIWLATTQAMRNTPRIRRVWDMLAKGLIPVVS